MFRITEVRLDMVPDDAKLLAFASITLDGCLVVHDLRILRGNCGIFVAMPSRKLRDRCPFCKEKNVLTAHFCNECGRHLADNRVPVADDGRQKLFADIAHPITCEGRAMINNVVLETYQRVAGTVSSIAEPVFGEGILV